MNDKKIVLVTGASRGIGQAISLTLGQQGFFVIGTATSDNGAANISETFAKSNISGAGVRLDVSSSSDVTEVLKNISSDYGVISILVNNAGITRDNLLIRMKDDEWNDLINTNLNSIYRVGKGVLRGMMKARFGRIISITSVVGVMGNPGQSNYSAAKAGVIGFSKSLAREVGSRGITVNTIAPGFIDTDMTKALPEEQRAALEQQIPLGSLGKVEDIANAVAYLASDEASYITGHTLHVNGGMYM